MTPDQLPLEEFLEEADDLVQELESSLLELESNLDDRSIVDRIFRAMHTIKGGAGMVMQSELSEYAHHLESLLDLVRSGVVGCTSELVSTLLKANDCIIGFIKKIRGEGEVDEDLKQTTLKELKSYSNPQSEPVVEEKINLKLDFLDTFQEGLKAYRKRQWKKGLSKFKECQKAAPTDPVYQVYIGRCENFITQSTPKNWNGVYEFQEK